MKETQELSHLSYFDETASGQQYGSRGLEVIDKKTINFSRQPKPAFMPKRACPFYYQTGAKKSVINPGLLLAPRMPAFVCKHLH